MDFDIEVVDFMLEKALIDRKVAMAYEQERSNGYNKDLFIEALNSGIMEFSKRICKDRDAFDVVYPSNIMDNSPWCMYIIMLNSCSLPDIIDNNYSILSTLLSIYKDALAFFPEFLLAPINLKSTEILLIDARKTFLYNALLAIKCRYNDAVEVFNFSLADKYMQVFHDLLEMDTLNSDVKSCIDAVLKVFFEDDDNFRVIYDLWWAGNCQSDRSDTDPSEFTDSEEDTNYDKESNDPKSDFCIKKSNDIKSNGIELTLS
ncbi:MAG: hypothetical protein LBH49_00820 [Puniceicoccales bacterium]|jgi:hypothetical protein|nr:hypothetical protein [Puniceicoccales bacterium]